MFIQKCQQNNAETVMIICFAQTIFKKKKKNISQTTQQWPQWYDAMICE
jgi:hypothetical protein